MGAILFFAASNFVAQVTLSPGRTIRLSNTATAANAQSQIEVPIWIDAQGDESSVNFSIHFNPLVVTNPVVALGTSVPPDSNLEINTDNLSQGQIGISINSSSPLITGSRKIATFAFMVPSTASIGTYQIAFGSVPTPQRVLVSAGQPGQTTYENGNIFIGTADGVAISGRVLTPDGRGLTNTTVIATDTDGIRRIVRTSSFGHFSFPYVTLGRGYTFTVQSKRYRFAPRVVQIGDLLTNFDFVGLE